MQDRSPDDGVRPVASLPEPRDAGARSQEQAVRPAAANGPLRTRRKGQEVTVHGDLPPFLLLSLLSRQERHVQYTVLPSTWTAVKLSGLTGPCSVTGVSGSAPSCLSANAPGASTCLLLRGPSSDGAQSPSEPIRRAPRRAASSVARASPARARAEARVYTALTLPSLGARCQE